MKNSHRQAVLIILTVAAINVEATSLKGTRPNVILVMTDDQGMADLSCMGNPYMKTPHIDKFYKIATRFTDFQVSPTCSPTRAAILSGRHEFKNGVTHTASLRDFLALSTTTFPQLLQKAGYKTGVFGKWHLGELPDYLPGKRGFDEVLIHGSGGIGQPADFPPNKENKYFDNVLLHNDQVVQTKGFCTDVFFQAALGWIKEQHMAKQPYFVCINPNAPHHPNIAPEKSKKRFYDDGWSEGMAGRGGMVENIDDNFGVLWSKLNEWKALENTIVIFMTDNGQSGLPGKASMRNGKLVKVYTAHFKTGKGTAYEGGTHVPCFWYWKGVLGEGVDIPALTAHIDFFKTFCDLAGVTIPSDIQPIDGRSLLPLLENPKAEWPDRKLFVHVGRWASGTDVETYKYVNCAVRTGRWRLVMPRTSNAAMRKGKLNNDPAQFQLYDIPTDPYEGTNVAEQHPETVQELIKAYDRWWTETVPLMVNEKRKDKERHLHTLYDEALKKGIPDWTPPTF